MVDLLRRLCPVLVVLLLLSLSACNTMRFHVDDGPTGEVVSQRKAFFLFGLTPTKTVDVNEHCSNGVLAVREQTTFLDGLLSLVTLGIYTPRSSWFYCRGQEGEQA